MSATSTTTTPPVQKPAATSGTGAAASKSSTTTSGPAANGGAKTTANNNNNNNNTPPKNAAANAPGDFDSLFKAFAKFGDSKSTGEAITLSNSDKWMKQAKVIDGKKITTTDTAINFKKIAKTKKALPMPEYKQFLEELAKYKKVELAEIKMKLASSGPPIVSSTAAAKAKSDAAKSVVERLTDHTKYTGAHKYRFDETGKGRGKAGRVDMPNESGYVQGFKNMSISSSAQ